MSFLDLKILIFRFEREAVILYDRSKIWERGFTSMEKEKIQLTDDLFIETYPFSDYITCVEVFLHGESFNAFCSDNDFVDEWRENPDVLIKLCNEHMLQHPKKTPAPKDVANPARKQLEEGLEAEFYSFSDDVYCINVYQQGKLTTSFCSDKASFEEWQDDPAAMLSVIKKLIKG